MQVELVSLEQSLSLLGGNPAQTYVVFRLPNGSSVRAAIDEEAAQSILGATADQTQVPAQPAPVPQQVQTPQPVPVPRPAPQPVPQPAPQPMQPPPTDANPFEVAQTQEEAVDPPVAWKTLPDETLPPHIKGFMEASQIPPLIKMSELKRILNKISGAAPQPPEQVQHPAPTPGVNQVRWNDGPVILKSVPRRTVPTDEKGYPIVPGSEGRDPGEVVGPGDGDEEGIPQM